MKFIVAMFCVFFLIDPSLTFAQRSYAVPFLLSGPSAYLEASGGAFTAMPTENAFGFYYNPAQLGQFSQNNNGALQTAWRDWIPGVPETNFSNLGLSLGYNLKKINENIPLSIGLGYMLNYLSYGENVWTDETGAELGVFDSYEYTNALALGVCAEFFVRISLGSTYKRIVSEFGPINSPGAKSSSSEATANAFDFGLQINLPFTELFRDKRKTTFQLFPVIELSYGYALVNVGDEMSYIDKNQADPLPRQARLGNGLKLGLGMRKNGVGINYFSIDYMSGANDILSMRDSRGAIDYNGPFGELNFASALFLWDDPEFVTVRRGLRINFFEIGQLMWGFIDKPGFEQQKSFGFAFNLRGILKTISAFSQNPNLKHGLNHFDLQFIFSQPNLNSDMPVSDGAFLGIAFGIYGF